MNPPRCRARACGHPVISGGAVEQSLDKTRRWLLDSGARIPDQVADLIRAPRPERHRTILLGGVRRKLLGVVPAHAGTQTSAAERWGRVARQNPAGATGFRRSDPGSSRRLDPGRSAGTTSNHSPRWRASQAPRWRARACGHPVIGGGAVGQSRSKTRRWLLDSGARIPDQVADLIRAPRPERHRTILLGGVRRKLLGVVPAHAGTQSSAAERWSRVARQNPAVVTGFRRSDPGSSRRLDPGPSAGTTSSHSPRWRASQAPRCRARACGHPVISGGAVGQSRSTKPGGGYWIPALGSRIKSQT